jgi:quinol-cytochrome oxidoreductase complex cytochrome b subunit
MVITVVLHMLRTFFYAAYKYPREITWITGVLLLLVTLGMGFTGYLLPWNQRAYWATTVGTSIAGTVPWVGPIIEQALRGGTDLSTLTLTRFFSAHIWMLPAALLGLVGVHMYLVIRLGISHIPAADE